MTGGVYEAAAAAALVLNSDEGKTFFSGAPVTEVEMVHFFNLLRGEVKSGLENHPDRKQWTCGTRGVMVVGTRVERGIHYNYCVHLAQEFPPWEEAT